MEMNGDGFLRPVLADGANALDAEFDDLHRICPFGGDGPDEDQIAGSRFAPAPFRSDIGYHRGTYAGHVAEEMFRSEGSSGGMAKWVLAELLRTDRVDYVVHVQPSESPDEAALFTYTIDSDVEGVRSGSRAAYYPVELSEVVREIRRTPGRYAITGVPCFIKGLHRLAETDEVVKERIRYTVGIVCGHQKGTGYGESLAWQLGVSPDELSGIDFRTKIPGRTAREKGVTAWSRGGDVGGPDVVQNLLGTDYQTGFFKNSACNFCDDVLAETADVAVGDAWLDDYVKEGNSIVVVRSPEVHEMVEDARAEGRLGLDPVAPERAGASQRGGLRDRREGLAYRLWLAERGGRWHPPKRVSASADIRRGRRLTYRARMLTAALSIRAFTRAKSTKNLQLYLTSMRVCMKAYGLVARLERLEIRILGGGRYFGTRRGRMRSPVPARPDLRRG
jgi:coenzyme F420-reducing hydrogenase beta subunit